MEKFYGNGTTVTVKPDPLRVVQDERSTPLAPDGYEWVLVPARPNNSPGEGGWYSSKSGLEQIQVNELWGLDFLEGNALKYLTRYKGKNGVEDLQKAKFYIDRIIMREQREGRG